MKCYKYHVIYMFNNLIKPESEYELLCKPKAFLKKQNKLYIFSKKHKLQDAEIMTLLKPKAYSDTFPGFKRPCGCDKAVLFVLEQ